MLFRRRSVDGEDARQGDGRESNFRVLIISTVAAAAILAVLYFGFGFGPNMMTSSGPASPEVAAPPEAK